MIGGSSRAGMFQGDLWPPLPTNPCFTVVNQVQLSSELSGNMKYLLCRLPPRVGHHAESSFSAAGLYSLLIYRNSVLSLELSVYSFDSDV